MRKYLLLAICSIISYSLADNSYLVRISWSRSVPDQFTVVYQSGSQCLILANEEDMQELKKRNAQVTLLETNPHSQPKAEYYAVYPDRECCPEINSTIFARYGTVLDIFDHKLIMKGYAEDLLTISECPIDLLYISLESNINPYRAVTIPKGEPVQVDPFIEQIIATVSADSCARLLRDLCEIYNRDASEDYNIEEVVPYLERKFLEYNCDSVYRLPVSGYDAPAVIGVRRGEKDPSLDRVCVIGAHPDTKCETGGRHQGAYDNGCGNVGYLEAARVMKDFTFENTILYVGFNAEEKGLKGSQEFVDELLAEGSKIIGGAVTYDMLGISPPSQGSISHTVSTANDGGQEFADQIEELGTIYNFPVRVSTTSDDDIPTDTKRFWQNGYVASCGKGGSGGGMHTKADSIDETFDSTWLATAVTPGIVTIAYYAVPTSVTGTNFIQSPVSTNPVTIHINPSGFLTITLSDSRLVPHKTVSIYNVSGKLIQTLVLSKKEGTQYTGVWNCCDSRGSAVSTGLYLITGTVQNKRFQKKVIIRR